MQPLARKFVQRFCRVIPMRPAVRWPNQPRLHNPIYAHADFDWIRLEVKSTRFDVNEVDFAHRKNRYCSGAKMFLALNAWD